MSINKLYEVENLREYMLASWLIYIQYQLVICELIFNHKFDDENFFNKLTLKTHATALMLITGYLIATYFFGRRFRIIYLVLCISMASEVLNIVDVHFFNCETSRYDAICFHGYDGITRCQMYFRIVSIFWLEYMICKFGVLDIAKIELLKNNFQESTYLILTIVASQ
jgi:hypothetical protein